MTETFWRVGYTDEDVKMVVFDEKVTLEEMIRILQANKCTEITEITFGYPYTIVEFITGED